MRKFIVPLKNPMCSKQIKIMKFPFFSIVTPAYNRANMLPATIESVLKQSFTNWEMIIVDDGSTDNTRDIVLEINDERIRYIYQKNAERSAARNNGISNAKGQYICFLDSDDFFESNHLEILHNHILEKKTPIAMFFVHASHFKNQKKEFPEMFSMDANPMIYFFTQPIIPARVCVHNEILKTLKFDEDIVIVEDLVLWVKIASEYSVYEIKEFTVRYFLHEDNSVNLKNNSYIKRYNGLKLFYKRYPHIIKKIPSGLKHKIISDTLFGIARYYNFRDNYWKMVKYLCLSIIFAPIHKQTKAKIHMALFPKKHL
jgi:glycosyltransferase involved in cell wall biosynthesis